MTESDPPKLVKLEECVWICEKQIGVPGYDFRFQDYFSCKHPIYWEEQIKAVARMGADIDYKERYERLLEWNVRLIHTPEEYDLTSNLPNWYPKIKEYTPKSLWFDHKPTAREIEDEFDWPVFLKGERQTSRHDRRLAIIRDPAQFNEAMARWSHDTILHWQRVVCRQYVRLKQVVKDNQQTLPKTVEFRTFWWNNACVGIGRYWNSETYEITPEQRMQLIQMGARVAERIGVTFLVVDLALRENGEWIVIECNDGQDSGYTGVNPFRLWNNIVTAVTSSGPITNP